MLKFHNRFIVLLVFVTQVLSMDDWAITHALSDTRERMSSSSPSVWEQVSSSLHGGLGRSSPTRSATTTTRPASLDLNQPPTEALDLNEHPSGASTSRTVARFDLNHPHEASRSPSVTHLDLNEHPVGAKTVTHLDLNEPPSPTSTSHTVTSLDLNRPPSRTSTSHPVTPLDLNQDPLEASTSHTVTTLDQPQHPPSRRARNRLLSAKVPPKLLSTNKKAASWNKLSISKKMWARRNREKLKAQKRLDTGQPPPDDRLPLDAAQQQPPTRVLSQTPNAIYLRERWRKMTREEKERRYQKTSRFNMDARVATLEAVKKLQEEEGAAGTSAG